MKTFVKTAKRHFQSLERRQDTDRIYLAPSIVDVKLRDSKPADDCDQFIVEWQMKGVRGNSKRNKEYFY